MEQPSPSSSSVPAAHTPDTQSKPKGKGLFIRLTVVIGIILLVGLGGPFLMNYLGSFEETDDAQIDGHLNPISSRISGTVLRINVSENEPVKAGQVLVELDPRDYQVAVDQAKANLFEAQGQLNAEPPSLSITTTNTSTQISTTRSDTINAQAALDAAKRDYQAALANQDVAKANSLKANNDLKRYALLVNKDEVSQEQYDTVQASASAQQATLLAAKASAAASFKIIAQRQAALAEATTRNQQASLTAPNQIRVNQANIQSHEGMVKTQQANLEQALLNLSYCKITAPIEGVVGKRSVEAGEQVQPGQELMSIVQLKDIWVTANFKETQLRHIRPGQKAIIRVDAFNKEYKGYVESLPGSSGSRYSLLPPENATGNYVKVVQRLPVRIRFNPGQDPDHLLRPGMSVEPKILLTP